MATFTIPYDKVQSIEYGQKAGRRIGATAGLVILAGPLGFLALMSKKRRHMVSVTWINEQGKTDAAVVEFGKDSIRAALQSFEARSGKPVDTNRKTQISGHMETLPVRHHVPQGINTARLFNAKAGASEKKRHKRMTPKVLMMATARCVSLFQLYDPAFELAGLRNCTTHDELAIRSH